MGMFDGWDFDGNAVLMIGQSVAHGIEGHSANLQVATSATANLIQSLGITALDFGGVPVLEPLLDFGSAGLVLIGFVECSGLLEPQRIALENWVFAQLLHPTAF